MKNFDARLFRRCLRALALALITGLTTLHAADTATIKKQEDQGETTQPATEQEQAAKDKVKKPILNEAIKDPVRLGEVVVTATRTERSKNDIAGSVSTYTDNSTQMDLSSNFRELVSDELDVSTTNNVGGGGNGGRSSVGLQGYTIRGIDGNRILIQTDNIRQADQYTFNGIYSIGRNYQDLESLKRVEILKGSASSLYGSDAIGGVVTYITKDPSDYLDGKKEPYYFDLKSAFDSSNMEFAETATAAFRTGQVDWLGVYTRRDGEQTENMGNMEPNQLSYNQNNALAKMVWHANEFNKLIVTGEYFNRATDGSLDNQIGGPFLQSGFGPAIDRWAVIQDVTANRYRASIGHQFDRIEATPIFDKFEWQGYYQATKNTENTTEWYNRQSTFPVLGAVVPYKRNFDRDYIDNIGGGMVQFEKRFDTDDWNHSLTYGSDVSLSKLERNVNGYIQNLTTGVTSTDFGTAPSAAGPYFMPYKEIPDSNVFRFGMYTQDEIDYGPDKVVSIVPGLRIDYYGLSVDNDSLYTKTVHQNGTGYNEWSVSPKIAVIGRPTKEVTTYGQFNRGFRAPTTEELNATFDNPTSVYRVVPNPNLKSETSYNFETGVRTDLPWVKASAAVYYNYYQDFIQQQTPVGTSGGVSIYQSTNIDQAQIYGTTISTEWPLGIYAPSLDGLSALLGTAFAWGDDLQRHQALDSVDPWKLRSGLRYKKGIWTIELIDTFVGAKESIPQTGNPQYHPPEYNTVDLVGTVDITPNTKFSLGVYNLTDQKYWLWQDVRNIGPNGNPPLGSSQNQIDLYTQPGINVRTSLTISF